MFINLGYAVSKGSGNVMQYCILIETQSFYTYIINLFCISILIFLSLRSLSELSGLCRIKQSEQLQPSQQLIGCTALCSVISVPAQNEIHSLVLSTEQQNRFFQGTQIMCCRAAYSIESGCVALGAR